MPSSIATYLRTSRAPDEVESAFRDELRKDTDRAAEYRVSFTVSDAEEQDDCASAYGLTPTVDGILVLPSGEGDDAAYRATLRVAQRAPNDDVLLVLDTAPIMGIRRGIAHLSDGERELFEAHVLRDSSVPVQWGSPMPWSKG